MEEKEASMKTICYVIGRQCAHVSAGKIPQWRIRCFGELLVQFVV